MAGGSGGGLGGPGGAEFACGAEGDFTAAVAGTPFVAASGSGPKVDVAISSSREVAASNLGIASGFDVFG